MKRKLTLAVAAMVLVASLFATIIPVSAADDDYLPTTVTKVKYVVTNDILALYISFDEVIADSPGNYNTEANINNYIKLNGKTLTYLETTYSGFINSNYIASPPSDIEAAKTMAINFDFKKGNVDGTDNDFDVFGTNTVEIMSGLTTPNGCKVDAAQVFYGPAVTETLLNPATEAKVTSVKCTTDNETAFAFDITFDKIMYNGPKNLTDVANVTNNILLNGKTLAELNAVSGIYVGCGTGDAVETSKYVLSITLDPTKYPTGFTTGIGDTINVLPGIFADNSAAGSATVFTTVRYDRSTSTDYTLYVAPPVVSEESSVAEESSAVTESSQTTVSSVTSLSSTASDTSAPATGETGIVGVALLAVLAASSLVVVNSQKRK